VRCHKRHPPPEEAGAFSFCFLRAHARLGVTLSTSRGGKIGIWGFRVSVGVLVGWYECVSIRQHTSGYVLTVRRKR